MPATSRTSIAVVSICARQGSGTKKIGAQPNRSTINNQLVRNLSGLPARASSLQSPIANHPVCVPKIRFGNIGGEIHPVPIVR